MPGYLQSCVCVDFEGDYRANSDHGKTFRFFFFLLNVRSLKRLGKLEDLEVLIHKLREPDVIVLTETWLTVENKLAFGLLNYKAQHSRRSGRGGGVVVFVHKRMQTLINDRTRAATEIPGGAEPIQHNVLSVDFEIDKRYTVNLYALYNPNVNNIQHCLRDLEKEMESMRFHSYVKIAMGDINVDLFKDSAISRDTKLFFDSYGLSLVNSEHPTRVKGDSSTLIDHVYIDKLKLVKQVDTVECTLSGHNRIYFTLKMPEGIRTYFNRFPHRMNSVACNYVSLARKLDDCFSQVRGVDGQSRLKSLVAFVGKCVEESSQVCKSRSTQTKIFGYA